MTGLGDGTQLGSSPLADAPSSGLAESAPENRKVLEKLLREEATGFEFFQAVRLLELIRPESDRVGGFGDPADEVVRFSVLPSLAFPASQIHELELPREAGTPAEMSVNFMGLVGTLGVLPREYTLLVAREKAAGKEALPDFLNIFEHRLLSLFYRAWKKSRLAISHEEGDGSSDAPTQHLFDLIGQGLSSFRGHLPIDERSLVFYASLLRAPNRSAMALEQLVGDYFGVDVHVEQFVGGWQPLHEDDLCYVSDDPEPSNILGFGAMLGDEVWDLGSGVRIHLGPLDPDEFDNFLPGRPGHGELMALTRFYGQDQFDFEVRLLLRRNEVPAVVLGGDDQSRVQLGWSTWLPSTSADGQDTQYVTVANHPGGSGSTQEP